MDLPRDPYSGAVYMLGRGMKILPLKFDSKLPVYKGWPEWSLTSNVETISTMGGNENWAVHPGPTGHFVVDLDNKEGKCGSETWDALTAEHGVPETFTVCTPTGGLHLYFSGEGQNTTGKLGEGIDTKAQNGYVVAPGSMINDQLYEIVNDGEMAVAPAWLVDLMRASTKAPVLDRPAIGEVDAPTEIERAIAYLKAAPEAVEGSGGDAQTFKVACEVRDLGISQDRAFELMLDHYNPRCVPEWDEEQLAQKIENAYRYSQNTLGAKSTEAIIASAIDDFAAVPVEKPAWMGKARPVDPDEVFPDDDYFLSINGEGIIERGDVAVLQAKSKSGKSSAITAMMASLFVDNPAGHDFLGWTGTNTKRDYVLHFDTEQKPKDSRDLMRRALKMAGLKKAPNWYLSVNLKPLTRSERRQAVDYYLAHYAAKGRVLAAFIDGIGDLCDDTNDKESSEKLGERVVAWTQHYGCAVVTVLHENPSAESSKMRGHLGTYFEMKGEAIIRLAKDDKSVFTLWAEKMRRGHIAKNDGPSWVWNKEKGLPTSCLTMRESSELEASAAQQDQRAECEAFLARQIAEGDKLPANELNRRANEEGRTFACANTHTTRFVTGLDKLLVGSTKFKIGRADGRGTYFVSRPFGFLG